jgi:hypothetical protein
VVGGVATERVTDSLGMLDGTEVQLPLFKSPESEAEGASFEVGSAFMEQTLPNGRPRYAFLQCCDKRRQHANRIARGNPSTLASLASRMLGFDQSVTKVLIVLLGA